MYEVLKYFKSTGESSDVINGLCALAIVAADMLPQCAETAAGLRKLLEARDCFLRAQSEGNQG